MQAQHEIENGEQSVFFENMIKDYPGFDEAQCLSTAHPPAPIPIATTRRSANLETQPTTSVALSKRELYSRWTDWKAKSWQFDYDITPEANERLQELNNLRNDCTSRRTSPMDTFCSESSLSEQASAQTVKPSLRPASLFESRGDSATPAQMRRIGRACSLPIVSPADESKLPSELVHLEATGEQRPDLKYEHKKPKKKIKRTGSRR